MGIKKFQSVLGGLLGIGVAIAAPSCSNQTPSSTTSTSPESQSGQAVVNVYTARHYDTDEELYQDFTKKTGIKINLLEGKDNELLERIKNEGTNRQADVLITVDAGRLWRAEEAKLLQPIQSDILKAKVPENLRHPDGLWFGLTRRARILVYNKAKIKPAQLSTYEALAEPTWKGRVCVRSSNNIYNQSLLGSFIESEGPEATKAWAKGLVANLARPPKGGDTDQIKAVAAGQCDVAIVNHYYLARMAQSKNAEDQAVAAKVGAFFPNQQDRGTHVNISGAGVVANAPHQKNAIAFLEYLTSAEAQTVFAEGNDEYPVVKDVAIPAVLKEYGEFKADTINVSAYGRNNPEAIKIADQVGWQ
ncbi:MAG: Fe(3+) ABC transporter substrate-binding protein [Acaryochloridaceae cyanobacterium SU_2_1]|nr:Fe(3+) ABC transporter substrate-binding protein [Acaryochloridaceae cyanobacterium SU_2_1]